MITRRLACSSGAMDLSVTLPVLQQGVSAAVAPAITHRLAVSEPVDLLVTLPAELCRHTPLYAHMLKL